MKRFLKTKLGQNLVILAFSWDYLKIFGPDQLSYSLETIISEYFC